ncbi:MAG: response regulator, partial [Bacteroidetes bacterium]
MRDPIAILLVDDDEEDYMLTRDIIERVNHQRYTVDWVDNYEKAREAIARQQHDVYLIDYRLGAMSGLELLREFVEKGCECPMILLTGQGDIEVDAQAMKAGASDYLIKSQLNTDQFERSIRYALQQSNNLREIRSFNTDLEARVEKRTQALRQAVLDLRQSQQLYNSIAANFPSGFLLVLNRDYRLELADGSEIGVLGARYKGNLAGEVITDIISEHERQALEPFLNHTFEGASSTCELPLGEFIFSFRGVPLLDPDGNISRILVVCNNITPQKQAEAEVHNALLKERQLNELKSRFISMASHEFRTPLGTILSSASLIARY